MTRIISWKKLLVLVAIGALVLAVAVPAMAVGGAVEQEAEQEAESGKANQGFGVSGSGENSNQCAGIQGVAQTGNAQNDTSLAQYRSRAAEFNLEGVGSNITADGNNQTRCEQGVNQAAVASGDNTGTGGNPSSGNPSKKKK
jgi:hypothetical protein